MRVENLANSIVKISHTIGKALQEKESQQVKKLFEILKLNWYAVRSGGGGGGGGMKRKYGILLYYSLG